MARRREGRHDVLALDLVQQRLSLQEAAQVAGDLGGGLPAEVRPDVIIEREMTFWARLGDAGSLTAAFERWRKQLELTAEIFTRLVQDPGMVAAEDGEENRPAALAG